MNDEFYVGYLPKMPPTVAKSVRRALALFFVVAFVCAVGFTKVQRTFAPSAFEYGKELSFEGTIEANPYPTLLVSRPSAGDGAKTVSRYTLVGTGKHGADRDVAPFLGESVRLKGQLIFRDGETLIEVMPGTVSAADIPAATVPQAQELGTVTLRGELVDSKCYFGVMNPGSGKVHRDCAVRCLSGGIPPSFVTNDYLGAPATFLLVGRGGGKLAKESVLAVAGRLIQIRGEVFRVGDSLYLQATPQGISPIR